MTKQLLRKILIPSISAILILLVFLFISFYNKIYTNNINPKFKEGTLFYIYTGSGFNDVYDSLVKKNILIDEKSFLWLAHKKNLKSHIYPGRYRIIPGMSNNQLINMLRSGKQKVVKLVINNIRTKNELAAIVSKHLETDSSEVLNKLTDSEFLKSCGYDIHNVMTIFLPNTYEFYWNTSAEEFFKRMIKENDRFWDQSRLEKTSRIPLGKKEVSILASIVQKETNHSGEMSDIAGVYINRLKTGMPLQADPTVVFALGDFEKRRVLKEDTKVDSPYNTYKAIPNKVA